MLLRFPLTRPGPRENTVAPLPVATSLGFDTVTSSLPTPLHDKYYPETDSYGLLAVSSGESIKSQLKSYRQLVGKPNPHPYQNSDNIELTWCAPVGSTLDLLKLETTTTESRTWILISETVEHLPQDINRHHVILKMLQDEIFRYGFDEEEPGIKDPSKNHTLKGDSADSTPPPTPATLLELENWISERTYVPFVLNLILSNEYSPKDSRYGTITNERSVKLEGLRSIVSAITSHAFATPIDDTSLKLRQIGNKITATYEPTYRGHPVYGRPDLVKDLMGCIDLKRYLGYTYLSSTKSTLTSLSSRKITGANIPRTNNQMDNSVTLSRSNGHHHMMPYLLFESSDVSQTTPSLKQKVIISTQVQDRKSETTANEEKAENEVEGYFDSRFIQDDDVDEKTTINNYHTDESRTSSSSIADGSAHPRNEIKTTVSTVGLNIDTQPSNLVSGDVAFIVDTTGMYPFLERIAIVKIDQSSPDALELIRIRFQGYPENYRTTLLTTPIIKTEDSTSLSGTSASSPDYLLLDRFTEDAINGLDFIIPEPEVETKIHLYSELAAMWRGNIFYAITRRRTEFGDQSHLTIEVQSDVDFGTPTSAWYAGAADRILDNRLPLFTLSGTFVSAIATLIPGGDPDLSMKYTNMTELQLRLFYSSMSYIATRAYLKLLERYPLLRTEISSVRVRSDYQIEAAFANYEQVVEYESILKQDIKSVIRKSGMETNVKHRYNLMVVPPDSVDVEKEMLASGAITDVIELSPVSFPESLNTNADFPDSISDAIQYLSYISLMPTSSLDEAVVLRWKLLSDYPDLWPLILPPDDLRPNYVVALEGYHGETVSRPSLSSLDEAKLQLERELRSYYQSCSIIVRQSYGEVSLNPSQLEELSFSELLRIVPLFAEADRQNSDLVCIYPPSIPTRRVATEKTTIHNLTAVVNIDPDSDLITSGLYTVPARYSSIRQRIENISTQSSAAPEDMGTFALRPLDPESEARQRNMLYGLCGYFTVGPIPGVLDRLSELSLPTKIETNDIGIIRTSTTLSGYASTWLELRPRDLLFPFDISATNLYYPDEGEERDNEEEGDTEDNDDGLDEERNRDEAGSRESHTKSKLVYRKNLFDIQYDPRSNSEEEIESELINTLGLLWDYEWFLPIWSRNILQQTSKLSSAPYLKLDFLATASDSVRDGKRILDYLMTSASMHSKEK